MSNDDIAHVPFLVLANKIDAPGACSEEEIRQALGLFHTYGKSMDGAVANGVRPIEVFMCSITRRMGYNEGFKWLAQFMV